MNQQNPDRWDLGRFIKTLSYFGVVPFLSSISWFQQLLGSRPNPKLNRSAIACGTSSTNVKTGVVLVAGAAGGVGKRVVWRLIERGYQVRALVREAERAQALFNDNVEIVEADITILETLTSAVMSNVKAIICCTGTRVQPVGGDTPNREKYYQGIKFYLPEVVDTPELVEYRGVQNLVQAATKELGKASETVFDFQNTSNDLKEIWGAVDDIVMGGVSESTLHLVGSAALFSGNVSTANSGGFASVRTRNFDPPLNLTGYDGVELSVQGDGKRYKFMLRTESEWDGVAYCYSFDTVAGTWINVRISFADFIPVFRAKTVKTANPLDPSRICAFQLMLSKFEYDGALNPAFEPGLFQLQVESIKVYVGKALPQFVMVSSAGVTRPGRSITNLEEPPAVRMNDQLGGILTWKLHGEQSVRESGIFYTIIRPCALTEEPGGQTLIANQGDTLKGKVSREDIAEFCVQALEHSQACGVTCEVAEGQNGCSPGDWACLFSKLQPDT